MYKIDYYKYSSNGNNFVLIDEVFDDEVDEQNRAEISKYIENCVSGIGCDSVIFLQKCNKKVLAQIYGEKIDLIKDDNLRPEYVMRIYERGYESNMCGNGLICSGHHLAIKHGVQTAKIATEIPTNMPVTRQVLHRGDGITKVTLGQAILPPEGFINYSAISFQEGESHCRIKEFPLLVYIDGTPHHFVVDNAYITFTGEPHLVFFKQNSTQEIFNMIFDSSHAPIIADSIIDQIGQQLNQRINYFPKGINVGFSNIVSRNSIVTRCFERGINEETYSCGTGAVAAASLASELAFLSGNTATILPWKARQHKLYADAQIHISKENNRYSMTTQSILLSEGEYYFPS